MWISQWIISEYLVQTFVFFHNLFIVDIYYISKLVKNLVFYHYLLLFFAYCFTHIKKLYCRSNMGFYPLSTTTITTITTNYYFYNKNN